jgi:hypothetical protein
MASLYILICRLSFADVLTKKSGFLSEIARLLKEVGFLFA